MRYEKLKNSKSDAFMATKQYVFVVNVSVSVLRTSTMQRDNADSSTSAFPGNR